MTTGSTNDPPGQPAAAAGTEGRLHRGLSRRHIRFIALGSAIGTGLFYGSAGAIKQAGPSVLLAYVIGGAVIFLVMRCLGEMAVRHPQAGSFGAYASRYLGRAAGFMTGWMYVIDLMIVVLADLTAFAIYMGLWFPQVPGWIWILAAIVVVGAVNLLHVSVFGELEFWLSLVKVGAIIAMIVGGIFLLLRGFQGSSPTMLWDQGGFFANGFGGFVACFALVLFGFGGIEVIGTTAAEADDPKRSIPMAINQVPLRILLFYVGALAIVMSLTPWHTIGSSGSPFVMIFSNLGMTIAASVLNVVVITAALSAINADIFACGRMAFGLAEQGDAPQSFRRTTRNGVPWFTALVMVGAMLLGAVLNAILGKDVFTLIASLVTFITVWVWVVIVLSHFRMRRELARKGEGPGEFPAIWWPMSSIVILMFFAAVIVGMLLTPETRPAFWMGAILVVLLYLVHLVRDRWGNGGGVATPVGPVTDEPVSGPEPKTSSKEGNDAPTH